MRFLSSFVTINKAQPHDTLEKSILSVKLISAYVITDCVITGSKTRSPLPVFRRHICIFHRQSPCQLF